MAGPSRSRPAGRARSRRASSSVSRAAEIDAPAARSPVRGDDETSTIGVPGAPQAVEMLDDPFVEPRPDEFRRNSRRRSAPARRPESARCNSGRSRSAARNRAGRNDAAARGRGPAGRTSGESSPGDRGSGRRGTSWSGPAACRRRRRRRPRAAARMWASRTAHGSAPPRPCRPIGRSGRPARGPSCGSAASAITRTIGSVLLARTCTQRSSQSSRRPSRRSARASGHAAAIRSQSAETACRRRLPEPRPRSRRSGADTDP